MRVLLFIWLLLTGLPIIVHAATSEPLGRVVGRIDCLGVAGCPGAAVLWPAEGRPVPDPRRFTLIPASVAPLEADGFFNLSAPAGEYYVGALLRRTPGGMTGPPRVGDLVYMTPDRNGAAVKVKIGAGEIRDIGNQAPGWEFAGMQEDPEMGVSGVLVDPAGQPVPGLLVFAFADSEVTRSPLAVSARSDSRGQFILPLAEPGKVYLRVRESYQGGRPQAGDYVGVFGWDVPRPLVISEGQLIEGLKIIVKQIPDVMQMKNPPASSRPRLER